MVVFPAYEYLHAVITTSQCHPKITKQMFVRGWIDHPHNVLGCIADAVRRITSKALQLFRGNFSVLSQTLLIPFH